MRSDLKADDVGVTVGDFLHDAFLPVLPVEGPGRAVAVQLPRGVLVAQDVVAHDREGGCKREDTPVYILIKAFLFSSHEIRQTSRSSKAELAGQTKHGPLLQGYGSDITERKCCLGGDKALKRSVLIHRLNKKAKTPVKILIKPREVGNFVAECVK